MATKDRVVIRLDSDERRLLAHLVETGRFQSVEEALAAAVKEFLGRLYTEEGAREALAAGVPDLEIADGEDVERFHESMDAAVDEYMLEKHP